MFLVVGDDAAHFFHTLRGVRDHRGKELSRVTGVRAPHPLGVIRLHDADHAGADVLGVQSLQQLLRFLDPAALA